MGRAGTEASSEGRHGWADPRAASGVVAWAPGRRRHSTGRSPDRPVLGPCSRPQGPPSGRGEGWGGARALARLLGTPGPTPDLDLGARWRQNGPKRGRGRPRPVASPGRAQTEHGWAAQRHPVPSPTPTAAALALPQGPARDPERPAPVGAAPGVAGPALCVRRRAHASALRVPGDEVLTHGPSAGASCWRPLMGGLESVRFRRAMFPNGFPSNHGDQNQETTREREHRKPRTCKRFK